ncbi:MAG: hypothetical protein ACRC7G_04330 [Beijerinckiaceae bacterium]
MMTTLSLKRIVAAGLVAASFAFVPADQAQAQSASCQGDFAKVMQPRMDLIQRINGFAKKRPSAGQACSTLGQLAAADTRLIKWMEENKDWCQIPDDLLEQVKGSQGQVSRSRGQACNAAKQQASQIQRARAQQRAAQQQQAGGGGAPAVGSGVRLPSGAL